MSFLLLFYELFVRIASSFFILTCSYIIRAINYVSVFDVIASCTTSTYTCSRFLSFLALPMSRLVFWVAYIGLILGEIQGSAGSYMSNIFSGALDNHTICPKYLDMFAGPGIFSVIVLHCTPVFQFLYFCLPNITPIVAFRLDWAQYPMTPIRTLESFSCFTIPASKKPGLHVNTSATFWPWHRPIFDNQPHQERWLTCSTLIYF